MPSSAHLAGSGVSLCDRVVRSDQQGAGVRPHSAALRGTWTPQLRAPQALQQLQVPHFTSGQTDGSTM